MKTKLFKSLAIVCSLCMNLSVSAQQVLLPFGQFTQQPWEASCYFVNQGESIPFEDWFAKDFDDTGWEHINGPISSKKGLSYFATQWQAERGTYYVRRHFSVKDKRQIREMFMYVSQDDACSIYLNGTLVYEYGSATNYKTVLFDEAMLNLVADGENVLAIVVKDNGSNAYLDNGLYAYSLVNSSFNESKAWTGTFDRYTRDDNYIGYRYGRTFRCEQTIKNAPAGLYRLSANACALECYDNFALAWSHRYDEIPARLFINADESVLPSAMSEKSAVELYRGWNENGGYYPNEVYGLTTAFKNGMYSCDVWSYYDPAVENELTLGLYGYAGIDVNRWAAWDNLNLTYYSPSEVKSVLDSMVVLMTQLNAQPQSRQLSGTTKQLIQSAGTANGYQEQAQIIVALTNQEAAVRRSIEAYSNLNEAYISFAQIIDNVTNRTSPNTIAEAKQLKSDVKSAYENGSYSNDEVAEAIYNMEKMPARLGYLYLNITVSVPGSLGDSILSKVDNFADVQSLKVSGKLNDSDISTISKRLVSLREVDMSGLEMTELPKSIFSEHFILEKAVLPTQLNTIGEEAFYKCYSLRHIDFPSALTTINRYAFGECDSLREAILPEGLTRLADYAFYSCENIRYVKFPSTLQTIESSAFAYNYGLETIDFSEGLTHINNNAFYDCYELDNLIFPSSLYYIGNSAFAYNRKLSQLALNEGLYQIEDNAFMYCEVLKEVTLPSSLVLCYASPFDYCDNLIKVTCLSIEPPYMTDQIPYRCNMEGRELYVPALALNVYKQTTGWDKFQVIKPIDYLPANFSVLGDLHLTLPENIPTEYKTNVSLIHDKKNTSYWQYGSLTVNGAGTLSMNRFSMFLDPNYQYDQSNREQNYTSLVNNSHLRADEVSVDMCIRNDRWTFICLPFDVKVSDIVTIEEGTTNWIIRKYDGQKRAEGKTSETWVKMESDDVLNAGEGYIIQASRYIGNNWQNFSGFRFKAINNAKKNNIFQTSDAEVVLKEFASEFAHNRSWNLIGNPYPCYYDTRFMYYDAPITVWNMNNNTYTAYNPADDEYILCPGEAFFVQRPVEEGSIIFDKDGRQTNRNIRALKNSAIRVNGRDMSQRRIINLTLSNGSMEDRTRVVINANASDTYEMDKDAGKFMSTDKNAAQLYSWADGVNYAINERPLAEGIISLAVLAPSAGIYSISIADDIEGYEILLEDKKNDQTAKLTADKGYVFSAEAGLDINRFVLRISMTPTGIKNADDTSISVDSYTLDGIKVEGPTGKGIFIQNGQKVVVDK